MTRDVIEPKWCPDLPLLSIRDVASSPLDELSRLLGQWRFDRQSRELRSFLVEHGVTTIMGEWLNFSAKWFPSVRTLGLPFFSHAHGYDVTSKALRNPWVRILYQRLRGMEGIITVNQVMKQRLVASLRLNPERIHVIPYGVTVPPANEPPARSEWVVCLCVGRLVEKKGPLHMLRAFHAAHRERPELRLEVVGDGPLSPECKRFCQENGMAGFVTFFGGRDHEFVKQRLLQADIFLLHSIVASNGDEEGLPVAILEAMAHGLPVVSTRHAGIPEAVLDQETGFLVAERDEPAMARAICDLAAAPALRRSMGRLGRARAVQRFTVERELEELRNLMFGRG